MPWWQKLKNKGPLEVTRDLAIDNHCIAESAFHLAVRSAIDSKALAFGDQYTQDSEAT